MGVSPALLCGGSDFAEDGVHFEAARCPGPPVEKRFDRNQVTIPERVLCAGAARSIDGQDRSGLILHREGLDTFAGSQSPDLMVGDESTDAHNLGTIGFRVGEQ